ncbi:hypothetical protein JTB14_020553 [Gonioctena quinquepunctata]|nr:hypothetical protein JTB14_020553 [Gonioctena quinquepunctata]
MASITPKAILLLFIYTHVNTYALDIAFTPNVVTVNMDEWVRIQYEVLEISPEEEGVGFVFYSEDTNTASLQNETFFVNPLQNMNGSFDVNGIFLGKTFISCINQQTNERIQSNVEVIVIRKERLIDVIFTASVATLVSLIYINFGCAMNWGDFKHILKKPIGPIIGFCGQFIFMPLLSYGLGQLLFPSNPAMQLGMFFTGASPGGGASNLWTLLLEGNISLSIAMTALRCGIDSTVGCRISHTEILEKTADYLVKMMKMLSVILLLFIIIFAIVTNLWFFRLFSWEIIVAGMAVPWLGYLVGLLISKLLQQPEPDCTAIAIEIGIQNTGIAIFLLRFSLPQPEADLTTVVPVSIAMLTPFPLLILFVYKKIWSRFSGRKLDFEKSDQQSVCTMGI